MARTDRKQEKKLKEAEKAYNKWKRAFIAGKITKDELKDKLRPYKYELHELNLVKLKEGDLPPKDEDKTDEGSQETGKEPAVRKPVTYPPWKKRSSLTMEEIEDRVDLLSLGKKPSETLKMLYEKRYGEELSPPEDPILLDIDEEDLKELPEDTSYGLPPAEEEDEEEPSGSDDEENQEKADQKKPFWKGLLKRKSEA